MGNALNVRDLLFIGVIALAATLVLTPAVRALTVRVGLLEKTSPRKLHTRPMPTAGGLAMFFGFWGAVFAFSLAGGGAGAHGAGVPAGLLPATLLIVVLGMVDDYLDLRPGVKLAGQVAAAVVFVFSGARIEQLGHPLGGVLELGWWSVPVTLLWLVAVTNVLNIIDGLDGLAAGMTSIAALPMLFIALQREQWAAALLAAALIGSTLGFLRYNFNPARLFMGDTGGMFLGFVLGAVAVEGVLGGPADVAPTIPVVALGVPVFDTACAIVRRAMSGRPIAQADDGHLHHRLVRAGLSQRQAVLRLYAAGAALALVSLVLLRVSPLQAFFVAAGLAAAALPPARRLGVLGELPGRAAAPAHARPAAVRSEQRRPGVSQARRAR